MHPIPGRSISPGYAAKGKHWTACGYHTGVDIAAPSGAQIYAPISGTIRHRNYGAWAGDAQFAISPSKGQPFADGEVFFAHVLTRPADGTEVKAGQPIARVGAKGNATGPHLHMEYHINKNQWNCGVMRNPQPVIDWQPTTTPPPKQWQYPSGTKVYQKYLKWKGHEQNSDGTSISIGCWQEIMDAHPLANGADVAVTEMWNRDTALETQKCQTQHVPPADQPIEAVFVGPKQFAHAKQATGAPYVWVADEGTEPVPPSWDGRWHASPSLEQLLAEVNMRWPDRSKASDGFIGDAEHSRSKSEHNPVGHPYGPAHGTPGAVHALDITARGIEPEALVSALKGDRRLWYIIYDRTIWSRTTDWAPKAYTKSNPHTTHIHVSLAAEDQAQGVKNELDTGIWLPVPPPGEQDYVTRDEFESWKSGVAAAILDGEVK